MSSQKLAGLVNKRKFASLQSKKFVALPDEQLPDYFARKKLIKRSTPSASSELESDDKEFEYKSQKIARVKTIVESSDYEEVFVDKQLSHIDPNDNDNECGFVVEDNVVEEFQHDFPVDDDDDDDKISAAAKMARITAFDNEVDEKQAEFEDVALIFERRSHMKKMENDATTLGALMVDLFFCAKGYDSFVRKFDELMLNKTLVCFKSNTHSDTIFAVQSQRLWKCKRLKSTFKPIGSKCFLCGYYRKTCKHCLFTAKDDSPIGLLGDECAVRWKMLEKVFMLRGEILSKMGCCDNKAVEVYERKISQLNEECIQTLQELHNKWAQTDENRIED